MALTGIGVLYGKSALLNELVPAQGGGGAITEVTADSFSFQYAPDKFEAGTPHVVGALSLAKAIEYIDQQG